MKRKERGITLIALVITIIVMLILVVATVTVALNGGLFKSAKKATQDTEIAREEESELSSGRIKINNVWYDSMEDYIAGIKSDDQGDVVKGKDSWVENKDAKGDITITRGDQTLNIGDYVGYTTDESPDTKWRVLGVEKGRLLLMADSNVDSNVTLQDTDWGEDGQGLIDILNQECQYYLNEDYGESIRSIKVEDINNITGYNPLYEGKRNPTTEEIENDTEHAHRYNSGGISEYGNKVTYAWSENEKVIYDDTGEGGNKKHNQVESVFKEFTMPPEGEELEEELTFSCTSYRYYPNTLINSSEGDEVGIKLTSPAYKMIFEGSSNTKQNYWLASPRLGTGNGGVTWGSFQVNAGGYVSTVDLWRSYRPSPSCSSGIRPVVSLKPDVKLAKNDSVEVGEDGSVTYKIGN